MQIMGSKLMQVARFSIDSNWIFLNITCLNPAEVFKPISILHILFYQVRFLEHIKLNVLYIRSCIAFNLFIN